MPKQGKKNCYAIVQGCIAPAICGSWSTTKRLTGGYSNNEYRGFITFKEAVSFMEGKGHHSYFLLGDIDDERAPRDGEPAYYAVANGENPGVYEYYHGGAEREITGYSNSCHKAFKSRKQAENFIEEYKITDELLERMPEDEDTGAVLCERLKQIRLE